MVCTLSYNSPMQPVHFRVYSPILALIALSFPLSLSAQQKSMAPPEFVSWLPISDAERVQKSPSVEKDAGAEILVWRVHVVDEILGQDLQRVLYNYIRLKVFDDKGKEAASTIDLPFRDSRTIIDIAGRTIRPDGSIAELDSKTVYKRDLTRAGGRKEKVASFAMPGVEPGSILEYRWKQVQDDNRFRYLRLHFAREFPSQKVTYFVRPLSSEYVATDQMFIAPFNCQPTPIKQTNDGWNETTLTNVPALHDEPFALSDPNIEPWALLYYREGGAKDPDRYWNDQGKKLFSTLRSALKVNDEQKATASKAIAGAKNDDEKIAALVTYVRKSLRDLTGPEVTAAEFEAFVKKMPKDGVRNAADILKGGIATPEEMNIAFAALAMQVGLEARPALVGDRRELSFQPKALADRYFLDNIDMAVKLGDSWKVFDVSRKYLGPGMLAWQEEGVFALIADPKAPLFTKTLSSPPDASAETRTAKLHLASNGSLGGDVDEAYTGHRAEQYRAELSRESSAQREEWFHDRVMAMFPGADVTAIKLENVDDPAVPFHVSYHLEAPSFAQVTGKRILLQPNAFRRARSTLFSASERRYPVEFPFAWKELDEIHIELPDGFTLENPENPGGIDFGDPGAYQLTMRVEGNKPELVTSRQLTFGNKENLIFPVKSYPTLKKIFDEVDRRDKYSIVLKGN